MRQPLFVILIGASDAPGGIEWDRVELVLPSEIELGEADRVVRLVLLAIISEAGGALVATGFDFDRDDLLIQVTYQIDFHAFRWLEIVERTVLTRELLHHVVFGHGSLINIVHIRQQVAIVQAAHMRQQAGVGEIDLEAVAVFVTTER